MKLKFFISIIIIQIIVLIAIKIYSENIKTIDTSKCKECNDVLNKTVLNLKFCWWNISHIIIFFIYCLILKPETLGDHTFIFFIGVVWFAIQYIFRKDDMSESCSECKKDICYENMLVPKFDDFCFNTLCQMFDIVVIYCLAKK